jgi:hypothetical protein
MLLFAANERPRLAAYRQMQQLMQEQQRQQQPRRRWKPAAAAAAAPAGALNGTAAGAGKHPQQQQQQQQQQIQLVPQQDIESPADNAPAAAAGLGTSRAGGAAAGEVVNAGQRQAWRWWGLRLHDIRFTASLLQLVGATIFWVSAMTWQPSQKLRRLIFCCIFWVSRLPWNGSKQEYQIFHKRFLPCRGFDPLRLRDVDFITIFLQLMGAMIFLVSPVIYAAGSEVSVL